MYLTEFSKTDIAAQIRYAAARNHLSHAMLFCGGKQRMEAASYTAAAMECVGAGERPCLICSHCRKVLRGTHPDVRFVQAEERKEISVEQCRQVRADAFLYPNEGKRKVYVFEDGTCLNERDQNILLKLVEEGPSYAVFFFCSENVSAFLPTLRSRCNVLYLPEEENVLGSFQSEEDDFCRAIAEESTVRRCEFLISLERSKPKLDWLAHLFERAEILWMEVLLVRCGKPISADASEVVSLTRRFPEKTLVLMIEMLRKYRIHCDENAGVGILIGGFLAEWEGIL